MHQRCINALIRRRPMLEAESSSPVACSGPSTTTLPERSKIGFVGLGRMGTAMAANLAGVGRQIIAYVRHPNRMDKLATLGLRPTTDITDLFDCEVVISMLPDAVLDVSFGRAGLGI